MSDLRVAVIGYGKLGAIHARLINQSPAFQLVAIVEPDAEAREVASRTCGVETYDIIDDVLPEIDCAIVATPTKYHHSVCHLLLDAGIHVFVEKPITNTVEEATELVSLADKHGLILQVGHVVRFDHRFRAAEGMIEAPRFIECTRTSGYTFRSMDVGVTLDLMIHDLDLVLSMINSPVASIEAVGMPVIGPHEDLAHARLTFENGAMANLTASRVSYEQIRKLQICGSQGFVSIDFLSDDTFTAISLGSELNEMDIDPTAVTPERQKDLTERFFVDLLPKKEVPVVPGNAIEEEHKDFAVAISTGRQPRVCGKTGLEVLKVAKAITTTIKSGQNQQLVAAGPHFGAGGVLKTDQAIHRSPVRGL